MADNPEANYAAMMQIGVEMAAPAALGFWLDSMLDILPWLTAVGAVLGLVLGLVEITRVGSGKDKAKPRPDDAHEDQLPGDKP